MPFLKPSLILPFLCLNQQSFVRLNQTKVSNSTLKPDLCNFVKTEKINDKAPPQQPQKRGLIFWDTPVYHIVIQLYETETEFI